MLKSFVILFKKKYWGFKEKNTKIFGPIFKEIIDKLKNLKKKTVEIFLIEIMWKLFKESIDKFLE